MREIGSRHADIGAKHQGLCLRWQTGLLAFKLCFLAAATCFGVGLSASAEISESFVPKDSSSYSDRGYVRSRVGDIKGAMQDFDKAIELDDKNIDAICGRGYLNLYLSDYKSATADFELAIAIDPKNASAYCGRGQARSELKMESDALRDLNYAIELDPSNAPSYIFRGYHLGRFGRYRSAIADYDRTIQLDPDNALAYCYRASAREAVKDREGAITDFDKVIEFDPRYAWAYYWRGHTRNDLGDRAGALKDYDRYIRLKPDDPWGFRGRGFTRQLAGDWIGAIQDYTKAIKLDPTDSWTFSARGFLRGKSGDTKGSIRDYKQARKLDKIAKSGKPSRSDPVEPTAELIANPIIYNISEKTLSQACQLFGKPSTAINQLLIFHRPGPHCQTVMWDDDKGIFCIFMANYANDPYFQGNLAHEIVHLLNARMCDPYMEGLCTVFGEMTINEDGPEREVYKQLVLGTPFYGETYLMMKELRAGISQKNFNTILNFAVYDRAEKWMHIDINKWLDEVPEPEKSRARQTINKYADAVERTMPKDGIYAFDRPTTSAASHPSCSGSFNSDPQHR